jgi:hypothetical protein
MITIIKSKQELLRALNSNDLRFIGEVEVVNEAGTRSLTDKAKTLLRQQKKLHVVLLERD